MTSTDLNNHLALIEQKCGFGVARELEALCVDGQRYRWIQSCAGFWVELQSQPHGDVIYAGQGGEKLTAAIDAARSAP